MDKKELFKLFRNTSGRQQIELAFKGVNCPKQRRALVDKYSREAISECVRQYEVDEDEFLEIISQEDGSDVISAMMLWKNTPSGHHFWESVYEGVYPL